MPRCIAKWQCRIPGGFLLRLESSAESGNFIPGQGSKATPRLAHTPLS